MDAVKRLVTELFVHRLDVPIATLLNTFWKERKLFTSIAGAFKRRSMRNVKDALKCKAADLYELYSFGT